MSSVVDRSLNTGPPPTKRKKATPSRSTSRRTTGTNKKIKSPKSDNENEYDEDGEQDTGGLELKDQAESDSDEFEVDHADGPKVEDLFAEVSLYFPYYTSH